MSSRSSSPRASRALSQATAFAILASLQAAACSPAQETDTGSLIDQSVPVVSAEERQAFLDLRQIEYRRLQYDARLATYILSSNLRVAAEGLRVAGQIRARNLEDTVLPMLFHQEASIRSAAAIAFKTLPNTKGNAALIARLAVETQETVKQDLLRALAEKNTADTFVAVLAATNSATVNSETFRSASIALALHLRDEDWSGASDRIRANAVPFELAQKLWTAARAASARRATPAALALGYLMRSASSPLRTSPLAAQMLEDHGQVRERDARLTLLEGFATYRSAESTALLVRVATFDADASARSKAISLLPSVAADASMRSLLISALHDVSPHVVAAAAGKIRAQKTDFADAGPSLVGLLNGSRNSWTRGELLKTINALNPEIAREHVLASAAATGFAERHAAISCMRSNPNAAFVAPLMQLTADLEEGIRYTAFDTLGKQGDAVGEEGARLIHAGINSDDFASSLGAASAADNLKWQDSATIQEFIAAYRRFAPIYGTKAQYSYLWIAGNQKWQAALPWLNEVVDTAPDLAARKYAATAIKSITGIAVDAARLGTANTIQESAIPSDAEIALAMRSSIRFTTERGTFEVAPNPNAPLAFTDFVRIVNSGYFDGVRAHRAVPEMLVQFGDRTVSGFGATLQNVTEQRDAEVMWDASDVGMAHAGWGTENSQIFMNRVSNLYFGPQYTRLGTMISGHEIALELEFGDRIVKAEVITRK